MLQPRTRRTHSRAFKAKLIRACREPGASIAAVAMAHQINDNLLRKWMRECPAPLSPAVTAKSVTSAAQMVPLQLTATPATDASPSIRLHIQRGGTQVHVEWPVAAAALCGEWVRSVLS